MAWTAPMTFTDGNPLTAAQLNTHLRDNLLEQSVAKATTTGSFFVVEAKNRIGQRGMKISRVATAESTDSQNYDDLNTPGPAVTCTTGTMAFVFQSVNMNVNAITAFQSWALSGATDREAMDETAVRARVTPGVLRFGNTDLLTTLTPGVNTFTAKYRVASGSATFTDRLLGVWPL